MMEKYDITQQIEPVRRTFLNVLCDNLKLAEKVIFVHRLIYIAEHSFSDYSGSSIGDCMEKIVQKVNDSYHDEPLTGLLVCYPKYFCHIIEGSEDSLYKHLVLLMSDEANRKKLGRTKMLVCYHHINQRFLPGWMAMTGKPPTLVEKIDVNSDLYRTSRHVYHCVRKLYKLALLQRPKISIAENTSITEELKSERYSGSLSVMDSRSTVPNEPTRTNVSFLMEKYPDCLPEYGLLDFLLSTPYTQDLQHYIDIYGIIKPIDAYKDKVWPVPTEFVPFNIFDKAYDPVTDLPTAKATAEEATDLLDVE
ncbi:hypothetical protein ILUMI_25162 [Ignelater luminosus]|uniref:BLUF domain-containing protein n=1 Tax=Ignelater luminosus TaxID=2038154 RepID=A0A8K0C7V1_IGNLU|nr:hypothetical protein ILUMI_25162 [Ignelater luminosus]